MKRTPFSSSRRVMRHLRPKSAVRLSLRPYISAWSVALPVQIHHLGGARLHLVGQLVGRDPRRQLRFVGMRFQMLLVQLLRAGRATRAAFGPMVPGGRGEVEQRRARAAEERALVGGRHVTRGPVGRRR